jgi:hypothetical protein
MNLTDKFTFGKGDTLRSVIWSDPTYVEWCVGNVEGFKLTKRGSEMLGAFLDQYYEAKYEAWDGVIDIYDFFD